MADLKQPWEQRDDEPSECFLAFKEYLHMRPPRTQKRVACATPLEVLKWSEKYDWRTRALALDRHYEQVYVGEREKILKQSASEVASEHMSMLTDARDIVSKELARVRVMMGEQGGPSMRQADLIKLMEQVVKLDRLVRGESTENTEKKVDFSRLSDEELDKLDELNRKVMASES